MNGMNSYVTHERLQPVSSQTKILVGEPAWLTINTDSSSVTMNSIVSPPPSSHNNIKSLVDVQHRNFLPSPANHLLEWQLKTGENLSKLKLPFPWKLHQLLDDLEKTGKQDIASWLPGGKSFRINNPEAFGRDIMCNYFRQSKFTSFVRQLYIYGFAKIESGPGLGGFYHASFSRDNKFESLSLGRNQCEKDRRCKSTKRNKKGAGRSSGSSCITRTPQCLVNATPPSVDSSLSSFSSGDPFQDRRQQGVVLVRGGAYRSFNHRSRVLVQQLSSSTCNMPSPNKGTILGAPTMAGGTAVSTTQAPLLVVDAMNDIRPLDEMRDRNHSPTRMLSPTNPLFTASSSSHQEGYNRKAWYNEIHREVSEEEPGPVVFQEKPPSLCTRTPLGLQQHKEQQYDDFASTGGDSSPSSCWFASIEKMFDSGRKTVGGAVAPWGRGITALATNDLEPRTIEEMTRTLHRKFAVLES